MYIGEVWSQIVAKNAFENAIVQVQDLGSIIIRAGNQILWK